MLGNFPMKKTLCWKFWKNDIVFLSARLIFAGEVERIFYPFSTSHWRMFDIVGERSVCITWSGRRMFSAKSLAGWMLFLLLLLFWCAALLLWIHHLQGAVWFIRISYLGFLTGWRKRALGKALAAKRRPEPFRPSEESGSWHRRCSKWRPSMSELVGGRERLEPGHSLASRAHALLWNDIRNTCNLWLAEGSRC